MTQIKINYECEVLLSLLKKEMRGRELSRELNTSLTRIQSILNELRNSHVLDYRTEGKNHVFFIKRNLMAKMLILNAENYKLTKIFEKYPTLEILFGSIIKKFPNKLIILFGSYAKFIPKEDSDIDIYVDTDERRVKDEMELLNSSLSVKIGSFNKDDLLIKEIIKNHAIIQGAEIFYEKLGFFK